MVSQGYQSRERGEKVEAEKFIEEKKRLDLAMCGKLEEVETKMITLLKETNLANQPHVALDVMKHTLCRLHLKKFKIGESEQ